MSTTKSEIKKRILKYIDTEGSDYDMWYVGIAKDPRDRLFNDHKVDEDEDPWIYRTAESNAVAREIEVYFIEEVGTDGGKGGGDQESKAVYAYRKQKHTDP